MFSYPFLVECVDVFIGESYLPGQVVYSTSGVSLAIGMPPSVTIPLERILGSVDVDGVYNVYANGFGAVYKMRRRPDRVVKMTGTGY